MLGHVIECSTYATGGYYSGFKDLGVKDTDMGYPIAAIEHNGEAVFTMEKVSEVLRYRLSHMKLTFHSGQAWISKYGHHREPVALRDPRPILLQLRCNRPNRERQT